MDWYRDLSRRTTHLSGMATAVNAVCGSGRAVDVIVGIAGSGKTTALDATTTAQHCSVPRR